MSIDASFSSDTHSESEIHLQSSIHSISCGSKIFKYVNLNTLYIIIFIILYLIYTYLFFRFAILICQTLLK